MKAKEYADKFVNEVNQAKSEEELNQLAIDIVLGLMKEAEDLAQKRHVKFDRGFIPICKEQNRKYNSIVTRVNKSLGAEILKENGYRNFLFMRLPKLKEAWNR